MTVTNKILIIVANSALFERTRIVTPAVFCAEVL